MTESGMEKMETMLREAGLLKGEHLYDIENVTTVHHVNQALRAHKLFARDKDYIVRNDEVVIIDEFTGRMMPGAATPKAYTKRWKQRASDDPARNQTSRKSLSRTISACIKIGGHDRHILDRSR